MCSDVEDPPAEGTDRVESLLAIGFVVYAHSVPAVLLVVQFEGSAVR
jgi:hypothetical protein